MVTQVSDSDSAFRDDRLLVSRVGDVVGSVGRQPKFLGFLDRHMREVARRAAMRAGAENRCFFWGGYEDAERVMLGIFPPGKQMIGELFPLCCVGMEWKSGADLTHRDFLGALMALGIKYDKIGDILVESGRCSVVADAAVGGFLLQNFERVGAETVVCCKTDFSGLKRRQNFLDITGTIASQRLDGVVAALIDVSRAEAVRLIEDGLVSVDFEVRQDAVKKVAESSTVSIRGHGRFVIDAIGPVTRKGRLKFAARKYN